MTAQIDQLLRLVGTARDGALLRFSIGNEYLKNSQYEAAIEHLKAALQRDPDYSAAWKLLGSALAECGKPREALEAYRKGGDVAAKRGDRQAAKEMAVFARRVEKKLGPDGDGGALPD